MKKEEFSRYLSTVNKETIRKDEWENVFMNFLSKGEASYHMCKIYKKNKKFKNVQQLSLWKKGKIKD